MRFRMGPTFLFPVVLVSALLITACGRGAPPDGAAADGDAPTAAALTVTTAPVISQELVRTVPATGSVYPWQEVTISSEVGGYRVAEVLVDVGSRVRKGQVLVRMSNDLLQADVSSRRAALRSAEASLENAAAALRRGESVAASGALSQADLDRLRAEHVAAVARVETARADLETAELRLRYGTVVAPDDGTITARAVSVGQIAQAGTEMLRMLRQDRVEWRAEVPESQLSRISAGQSAKITTADGATLDGRVRMVAPTVQTNTRTGLVYVDITGGKALPGMFARGEIAAGSGAGLLVPVSSVVVVDGYSYVYVLGPDNVVERRRVEQAGVHGDMIEVSSGVVAGDIIAVKGAGFLKDGDKVDVANAVAANETAQDAR
jgi:HlyD family secretion protein